MSKLHDALSSLRPTSYSNIPIDDLANYLQNAFQQAELILNSVPPPPGGYDLSAAHRTRADPRPATSASEIRNSNVRPPPPDKFHEELQKVWGKPLKLGANDNPLGISVYKMAGHDRRGAWFARRSVHEGLGFERWKRAMQREFPASLAVQKGPGEGSVRGIGGDRVLERKEVEGLGKLEVYQLSAKFPPPTSPRDFVTLLASTDSGLSVLSSVKLGPKEGEKILPRSWMVISVPVEHPDAPPKDGLVRGQYESVELVREIPLAPSKSQSTTKLPEAAKEENTERPRGATVPIEKVQPANPDEDPELNPVEWIMVTRSDPGGGIPRFLVDRGTPPSIASDAVKFLDWACARDEPGSDEDADAEEQANDYQEDRRPSYTSLHRSFTAGVNKNLDRPMAVSMPKEEKLEQESKGIMSSLEGALSRALVESTHDIVKSHVPGVFPNDNSDSDTESTATSSLNSFASAEPYHTAQEGGSAHNTASTAPGSHPAPPSGDSPNASQKSLESASSPAASRQSDKHLTQSEKELTKIDERKRQLEEKLIASREKQDKCIREATIKSKEEEIKTRERHDRDMKKQEERHAREMRKLEERRQKEVAKLETRRKKEEGKNQLSAMQRERDEWMQKAEVFERENNILRERMGELQRENTLLVAKLGKIGEGGHDILRQIRAERGMRTRGISVGSKSSMSSEERKKVSEKEVDETASSKS